jgi:hypothetical protein
MTTGHIRQRGKTSWELKFDAGPDPATGRRRIRYQTVRGSKRDAQRELRKLLSAVDDGQHVEPTRLTVDALVAGRIDLWRTSGRTSTKTAERHRELARHQIGRIGDVPLQKLTTSNIEAWHAGMLAAGLSPRTISTVATLISRGATSARLDQPIAIRACHRDILSEQATLRRFADFVTVQRQVLGLPPLAVAAHVARLVTIHLAYRIARGAPTRLPQTDSFSAISTS